MGKIKKEMMRRLFCVFSMMIYGAVLLAAHIYQVKSPDKKLLVMISTDGQITYSVKYDGVLMMSPSPISMQLDNGMVWGKESKVISAKKVSGNKVIRSPFYQRKEVADCYNGLILNCGKEFDVEFRAYDEGMAYRFISKQEGSYKIVKEQADFKFNKDYRSYIAYAPHGGADAGDKFNSSFEEMYTETSLSGIAVDQLVMTPALVVGDDGKKMCIAESDVISYPGMFLTGAGSQPYILSGMYANYPEKMSPRSWNDAFFKMENYADYIAKCDGPRTFPWRILCIADNDAMLLSNDMVYRLATPSHIEDTSWIKPGLATWDYWNNWEGQGESGKTIEMYKKFIDFAASKGLAYYVMDSGWAKYEGDGASMLKPRPEIHLEELVKYANAKGVGLILWGGSANFAANDMEEVCRYCAQIGIKGFKIDFWEYDNQRMMELLYKAAEITAKYKQLLIYHGCPKPVGLDRTFPNIMSYEAIKGMEYVSTGIVGAYDMIDYNVTFPFIRQVAGASDYTPGAMKNLPIGKLGWAPKASEGTRCQQIALFVTIFSPIGSLCDSPTSYYANKESVDFISRIPTTWDETIPMNGMIGQYIVMARQKDDKWFVGGVNNKQSRTITLDFSFLPIGDFQIEWMRDAKDADVNPENYIKEIVNIPSNRKLVVEMAQGGGFAGIIQKK